MGLRQNLASEPVSRLDLRKPVLCGRSESVRQAVERMRQRKLGCAIVIDIDSKPIGLFTESMLTRLLNEVGTSLLDDAVSNYVMNPWPTVVETDPIWRVLQEMEIKNTRFLGVLDESGRVVGLTGQKGLMEYVSEHFPQQVMVQRVGSKPPADREGA